jgi:hypothetical protein
VNGFTRKEEWARWYNENARTKNPIRQIQKIIAGPKPKEANSVRVITIRPGATVKFVGFGEFEGLTVKLKEGEAAVQLQRNRKYDDAVRLPVTVVKDAKQYHEEATEGELSSPAPVEKKNKKDRTSKTHALNTKYPMLEKTRCGKPKTEQLAEEGNKPTCKTCARLQHENRPASQVLADFKKRQAAKEAKKKMAQPEAEPIHPAAEELSKALVATENQPELPASKTIKVQVINETREIQLPTLEEVV